VGGGSATTSGGAWPPRCLRKGGGDLVFPADERRPFCYTRPRRGREEAPVLGAGGEVLAATALTEP